MRSPGAICAASTAAAAFDEAGGVSFNAAVKVGLASSTTMARQATPPVTNAQRAAR